MINIVENYKDSLAHLNDCDLEVTLKFVTDEIERRKKPKDLLERERLKYGSEYFYVTIYGQASHTWDNGSGCDKILFEEFNYYPCDEYTREEVEKIALQQKAFRKLQFAAKRLGLKMNLSGWEQLRLYIRKGNPEEFNRLFSLITEEERKAFEA